MKTFVTLALTLVLTAACLVGCGCTNQNMDNTSAPTVLPTNEEIWNSSESTTRSTTEATLTPEATNNATESSAATDSTDSTDSTGTIENGKIQNQVNKSSEITNMLLEKGKNNKASKDSAQSPDRRMTPGTR